jgi:hypothetical protein
VAISCDKFKLVLNKLFQLFIIYLLLLTYGFIGKQRFVIKAENLGDIVKIWMLYCKSPKRIVQSVIEICHCHLNSPIVLIVSLHMPVYPDRAHMMSTLKQWFIVPLWSMYPYHVQKFGITPALPYQHIRKYLDFIFWLSSVRICRQCFKNRIIDQTDETTSSGSTILW